MQIYNKKLGKQRYVIKNAVDGISQSKRLSFFVQRTPWAYTEDGATIKNENF